MHSQAAIQPPPLRDPHIATTEWRDRGEAEEMERRQKGRRRARKPGVVIDLPENPDEERPRKKIARRKKVALDDEE